MPPEPKTCQTCGRRMDWRRAWAKQWDQVRYCSQRCRRQRPSDLDAELERAIRQLLADRPAAGSICPSEAARLVRPDNWRPLMERARAAARRLVAQGLVVITQKGRVVDPSTAKGPIRVARGPAWIDDGQLRLTR